MAIVTNAIFFQLEFQIFVWASYEDFYLICHISHRFQSKVH